MNIGCVAYKLFHLVGDDTTNVNEKVFLVQKQLDRIKYTFNSASNLLGLMGTKKSIVDYVQQVEKKTRIKREQAVQKEQKPHQEEQKMELILKELQNKKSDFKSEIMQSSPSFPEEIASENEIYLQLGDMEEVREKSTSHFVLKLQLEKNEKAAIYFINIETPNDEMNIVFLALVTEDHFYHKKPYDQKSIMYLLVRFLGDICSNIILLYDQVIDKHFQEKDCPFAVSAHEIWDLRMVERSIKDIKIDKIPFDVRTIFDFDSKYEKKVRFNVPTQNKYILYTKKLLKEHQIERNVNQQYEIQKQLWKYLFIDQSKDINKLLFSIHKKHDHNHQKIMQKLIQLPAKLKEKIKRRSEKAYQEIFYEQVSRFWSWNSGQFTEKMYKIMVTWVNIKLVPEQKKVHIQIDRDTVIYEVIKYMVWWRYSQNVYVNYYYKRDRSVISQLWIEVKSDISQIVKQFYSVANLFSMDQGKMEEQIIDLLPFEINVIYNKEDMIEKVSVGQSSTISLKEDLLFQSTSIPNLSSIDNINVFELKNHRRAKLIWVELKEHYENLFQSILFTIAGNDIKVLKKYKKKNLSFTFNPDNQKGYLLNKTEFTLQHFGIDSIERIHDEKTLDLRSLCKDKQVISYGITISKSEKLFYLTEKRNIIYGYDFEAGLKKFSDGVFQCYKQRGERKYLKIQSQTQYEFIRTFNEDIYFILGNNQVIDICSTDKNGIISTNSSIKVNPHTFLGVSVLANKSHEFLLIHDSLKPSAIAFKDMNIQNILCGEEAGEYTAEGNPILDVYYDALQKFGAYTDQNTRQRSLTLHHVSNLYEQKIRNYLKKLFLKSHDHKIYGIVEGLNLYDEIKEKMDPNYFIEVVLTRIPLQLCTLEEGNLVPLNKGRKQNYRLFQQLSVAERSRILDYGMIEQILLKQPEKKVLVVSVMGAQSTGKSYLMNRIFGTRFTVSSSRTTIGIWLSLIKTPTTNYLLLDCEGLFSPDRSSKQEEKLINVLSSLSDFTILNLNMSMNNRSLTDLMSQVSSSSSNIKKNKKNKELYIGELFVIVRDVNEAKGIRTQFERIFKTNEKSKSNLFLKKLFGGNIKLFPVVHFQNENFMKDIEKIRQTLKKSAEKSSRESQDILESLKIVITELACDDSKDFEENRESYKMQKVKEQIFKVWMEGSAQNRLFTEVIAKKTFRVNENQIIIKRDSQNRGFSLSCLFTFDEYFSKQILEGNPISSAEFSEVYRKYNEFIINFFQNRLNIVEDIIQNRSMNYLKYIPQQKRQAQLKSIRAIIYSHQKSLSLCMQNCAECKLPCIGKHGHKQNIQLEKQGYRIRKSENQSALKETELDPDEQKLNTEGLVELKEVLIIEHQTLEVTKKNIQQKEALQKKRDIEQNSKVNKEKQIKKMKQFLSQKQKHIFKQKLLLFQKEAQKLIKSFESIQHFIDLKSKVSSIQKCNFSDNKDKSTLAESFKEIISVLRTNMHSCNTRIDFKNKEIQETSEKIFSLQQKLNKLEEEYKTKLQILSKIMKQSDLSNLQIKRIKAEVKEIQQKIEGSHSKFKEVQQDRKKYDKLQKQKLKKQKQIQDQINKYEQKIKKNQQIVNEEKKFFNQIEKKIEIFENKFRCFKKESMIGDIDKQIEELQKKIKSYCEELKMKDQMTTDQVIQQISKRIDVWQSKIKKRPEKREDFQKKIDNYIQWIQACEQIKKKEYFLEDFKKNQTQYEESHQIFLQKYGKDICQVFEKQLRSDQDLELRNRKAEKRKILGNKIQQFLNNKGYKKSFESSIFEEQENPELSFKSESDIKKEIEVLEKQFDEEDDSEALDEIQRNIEIKKNELQLKKVINQFQKWDKLIANDPTVKINAIFQKNLQQDFPSDILKEGKCSEQLKKIIINQKKNIDLLEEQFQIIEDEEKIEQIQIKKQNIMTHLTLIEKYVLYFEKLEESVRSQCKSIVEQIAIKKEIPFQNILIHHTYPKQQVILEVVEIADSQDLEKEISIEFQILVNQRYETKKKQQINVQVLSHDLSEKFGSTFLALLKKIQELGEYLPQQDKQLFKDKVENKIKLFESENIESASVKKILLIAFLETAAKPLIIKSEELKTQISHLSLSQIESLQDKIKSLADYSQEIEEKKALSQQFFNEEQENKKLKNTKNQQLKQKTNKNNKQMQQIRIKTQQNKNLLKIVEESLPQEINQLENTLKEFSEKVEKLTQITITSENIIQIQIQSSFAKMLVEEGQNQKIAQNMQKVQKQKAVHEQELSQLIKRILQFNEKIKGKSKEQIIEQISAVEEKKDKIEKIEQKLNLRQKLEAKAKEIEQKLKQLEANSKMSCSCGTSHECSQKCSAGCKDKLCKKQAGHTGDHLCEKIDHMCGKKCEAYEGCTKTCTQLLGHEQKMHNCHSDHKCCQQCKYCEDKCCKGQFEEHDEHICDKTQCSKKCVLCGKQCSKDHSHKVQAVKIRNPETGQYEDRENHLCDDEHSCQMYCANPGICSYSYVDERRTWEMHGCITEYTYINQIEKKLTCQKKIPQGRFSHEGPCQCSASHKCNHRCPDCSSVCQLPYGHEEEKHQTQHRNQEMLIYAGKEEEIIQVVDPTHKMIKFKVGDESTPTTCYGSCERRGRGHYHLVQCKGGDHCLEKIYNSGAQHSDKTYYPHPEKKYDMLLCKVYWDHHNFVMPNKDKESEYNQCNYACLLDHGHGRIEYCQSSAWHSESTDPKEHDFLCAGTHIVQGFDRIEVCFLIDATGSMHRFIGQCKNAIKNIIQKANKKKMEVLFSIVGYRDHPMENSAITKQLKSLIPKKRDQLLNYQIKDYHLQNLSQLVMVKYLIDLEEKYEQIRSSDNRDERIQQLRDVEQYTLKFHYPFVLDVESTEDFVHIGRRIAAPLKGLLQLLGGNEEKSLKQHILQDLDTHEKIMADLQKQEREEKYKLIEKMQFSESDQVIEFLNNLEADGGGDPPEAVLDGMDQVTKLKWTLKPNTKRYVFHIFDAPPHGRIYGTNNNDRYPDGCPCGRKHEDIIEKINQIGVEYVIYPLTQRINQTLSLFEEDGLEFTKEKIDKENPEQFSLHAAQLVCKKMDQQEILIQKEQ